MIHKVCLLDLVQLEDDLQEIFEFLGKTITDHDPIFFRNTSIKRGSWSGLFFQDPQKRDFTFCDCHFRSTTWVRIMLKTIRIMLKTIQNYQIYQNYVDSWKNNPDHDPLFILVILKKIGSWSVIVLPKNSNVCHILSLIAALWPCFNYDCHTVSMIVVNCNVHLLQSVPFWIYFQQMYIQECSFW